MRRPPLIRLAILAGAATIATGAFADSYYFRTNGANVELREGVRPTAEITTISPDFRSGTAIMGTLTTSLNGAAWGIVQSPQSPSLSLSESGNSLNGAAPEVTTPTTFTISGTATQGDKSASGSTSITVHPALSLTGGPMGQIDALWNKPVPAQGAYDLIGKIGNATYALTQNGSAFDLGTACPGLSISSETGSLTGQPSAACSTNGLKVQVSDSFDNATTFGPAFNIAVTIPPSNVKAWGANWYGQLGDGTTTSRKMPTSTLGGSTYVKVVGGYMHTCGIVVDGTVECWGKNDGGELGNGTTTASLLPVKAVGISSATDISAGNGNTCVIDGGIVKCWGTYPGSGASNSLIPVQVSGLGGNVSTISSGMGGHSCAVSDGNGFCWGGNSYGKLGDGSTASKLTAVQVIGPTAGTVTSISAGSMHSCLVASASVYCMGYNGSSNFGNNSTANSSVAIKVGNFGTNIKKVVTGSGYTCALNTSGNVKCAGYNAWGEIGNGSAKNTIAYTPV